MYAVPMLVTFLITVEAAGGGFAGNVFGAAVWNVLSMPAVRLLKKLDRASTTAMGAPSGPDPPSEVNYSSP